MTNDQPDTARRAAAIALASTTTFVVVYLLTVHTALGQSLDDSLMVRSWYLSPTLTAWCSTALSHYHEATYGLVAAGTLLVGLALRGPRRALAATATLGAVLVSAEALKHGLPRPDLVDYWGPMGALTDNSFPSGHTAGIAGLAAAATVLAPARWRRSVVGLGLLATLAVGIALVVAQWHRPSDIVGSALLAIAWGAIGVVAADAVATRAPRAVPVAIRR